VSSATATNRPPSLRGLIRTLVTVATGLQSQLLRDQRQLCLSRDSLAAELRRNVSPEETADLLAQSAACAAAIIATQPREWSAAGAWCLAQSSDWERSVLDLVNGASLNLPVSPSLPPATHLYEPFLHAWQRNTRKRRGVFFTPQPIADYIVRQVDECLRQESGLDDGLADMATRSYREGDASRSPWVLDPACGTGVFLLAVIDHLHRQLGDRFSGCVPNLLPRLIGVEILPAAAFLAKLNIALKLAETGYDFRQPGKINIHLGDALDPALQSKIQSPKSKIAILLGNPPFSSLSTNTNPWIARLVRGDDAVRGYVRANGQSLGERKTWLHDDYVKFIRLAQWHVEQAGQGIVGFVTNHGYLDNATFRLMRSELLRVFPHIQIVDLHGNRKKGEVAPSGERDENVFGLDQGVAIAILARSVSEGVLPRVEYAELWGTREKKLAALGTPSLTHRVDLLAPSAPDWRFVPGRYASQPEYDAGWLLTELMPANAPAPVTARDHFVVAFTAEELRLRIEEFCDLSIPDDEIRLRYFTRTRSSRYESGDTRGWKLPAARRIIAADHTWQDHIVRCLYRPFDWRYVFWHPAMIDWPRTDVTRHLLSPAPSPQPRAPICLLARRQQLPTQPCTFFWVSDGLALDGVIRSDNRGSESLLPLYLIDEDDDGQPQCRANFSPAAIDQVSRQIELAWQPLGQGDLQSTFGPEDLLGYIYALFHSPIYRERYADRLRTGFPRVLPPRSVEQFRNRAALGRELIDLHLLRTLDVSPSLPHSISVEDFRAGGYTALKKWLQPPHRSAANPEYAQIAAAIARTLQIMQQIDAAAE
jgi:predicted helicase